MVPGDDEQAARSSGRMYSGHRVYQFYDGDRAVGVALRRDIFADCAREALSVMPREDPLYEDLSAWASSPHSEGPLWDVVLFYPPGVEWTERIPQPAAWSKQVGFRIGEGGTTGVFFRDNCRQPPAESDWHTEVRNAMSAVLRKAEAPK